MNITRRLGPDPHANGAQTSSLQGCPDILELEDGDFATLRGHGFSDDDIWDIGAISAFFGLSNRLANLSGMRPNDEFYLMGRVPKTRS